MEKTFSETRQDPREGETVLDFLERSFSPSLKEKGLPLTKLLELVAIGLGHLPVEEALDKRLWNPLPLSDGERADSFLDSSQPSAKKKSSPRGRGLRICGILYPDGNWLDWSVEQLSKVWGSPHRIVSDFPFDLTDYYADISPDLRRAFVSFHGLKMTADLPSWKIQSCAIERLSGESRRVNLDPGYVDGARVVLASTKDHSHRIYMGHGIFAEVTMRYCKGKWLYYPHTFPDFKTGRYDALFSLIREDWRHDIRGEANEIDRTLSDR